LATNDKDASKRSLEKNNRVGSGDLLESGVDEQRDLARDLNLSPQQVGAAISKILAASIGDLVVVFSRSASHKHYSLADIEWMILPAVFSGQVYIAEIQHSAHGVRAPVAAILWASVSADVHQRLAAGPRQKPHLRPDEWKSGEHLWIIDAAGEASAVAAALARLAATQFKGKTVSVLLPQAQNGGSIHDLHELLAANARRAPGAL
jgi:cytolysin-activating lysine-acyltransferase